jgi:HAD superfamily hydrolase (TIGR01549 family)
VERALTADRWVCLDIGETLIDETRVWSTWATVLGVTPLVLMATMGVEIAAGRSYDTALTRIDPSWHDRLEEKDAAYGGFRAEDLYPDALPALAAYRDAGLGVAVIGNQPPSRTAELRAIGVAPDVMAMSDELGVSKPDPAFFAAALEAMGGVPADRVTYVGDRVDNDVVAASAAGLRTVHLRRGPWGLLGPQADGRADGVVDGLLEVLDHL